MKNQSLESARVHLRSINTAQNKTPLHLAVLDLFAHSCGVAGVSADLNPPAESKPETDEAPEPPASEARAAGLKPAPRAVPAKAARGPRVTKLTAKN